MTINQLKHTARVAEVADVTTRLISLYKEETALQNDSLLKDFFKKFTEMSELVTEAIKSDTSLESLEKVDAQRDAEVKRLDKILKGYLASPIEETKQAAEKLQAVFVRYGTSITRKSYSEASANIEALLVDLKKPSLETAIEKLSGVQETITALHQAQTQFNEVRLSNDTILSNNAKKLKSADLKKILLLSINQQLLPFISSAKLINGEKYEHFANVVEQLINEMNSVIKARTKKGSEERKKNIS